MEDVDQAHPHWRRPGPLPRQRADRMRRLRIGADDERRGAGGGVRGRAAGGGASADEVRTVRGETSSPLHTAASLAAL